jgi:hypothetical protein
MSEDDSASSFIAARAKLSESIERNVERAGGIAAQLDKTLISLSAGALVFSMTFVGAFAPRKLALPFVVFRMESVRRLHNMYRLCNAGGADRHPKGYAKHRCAS